MASVNTLRAPEPSLDRLLVAVIGNGNIGSTLISQLTCTQRFRMQGPYLVAVCNSRRMLLKQDTSPWSDKHWQQRLPHGETCDLDTLTTYLEYQAQPVAIVDATASAAIANRHPSWLRRGIHVVTANKLAISSSPEDFQQLTSAMQGRARYLYETTVGAGLPILGVLRDFVATGDEVIRVEGILSGTLSRLAIALEQGADFDATVRQLQHDGYTEPDPAIDLSGIDVARKLVILARAAGLTLNLDQIDLTPFRFDRELLRQKFANAAAQGKVLRYVAQLHQQNGVIGARVGLVAYPADHGFARINRGDNIVQITTERYRTHPLVIQGPGAGREVTAAGIFADLLKI